MYKIKLVVLYTPFLFFWKWLLKFSDMNPGYIPKCIKQVTWPGTEDTDLKNEITFLCKVNLYWPWSVTEKSCVKLSSWIQTLISKISVILTFIYRLNAISVKILVYISVSKNWFLKYLWWGKRPRIANIILELQLSFIADKSG